VSRWPLWRLLVWIEAWLLAIAAMHRYRPLHQEFLAPLLVAVIPACGAVAVWSIARRASRRPAGLEQRASRLEALIASATVIATAFWIVEWAIEAREDLNQFDAMLGRATVIIDVSLTGLSAAACLAALALDWILSTAHETLRNAMTWLRRTHVLATVIYVVVLFGAAWLFLQWPDTPGHESAEAVRRARTALYVYEFAKATVFPAQAFFAALAVVVVVLDSREA
jgi:hypothetical protein